MSSFVKDSFNLTLSNFLSFLDRFSLILSNETIVSLIEYPIIANTAAINIESTSNLNNANKANIIAARAADYANDATYKAKIDALTDAMLSKAVSDFFATKYLGAMTCDASSQIDLRK